MTLMTLVKQFCHSRLILNGLLKEVIFCGLVQEKRRKFSTLTLKERDLIIYMKSTYKCGLLDSKPQILSF